MTCSCGKPFKTIHCGTPYCDECYGRMLEDAYLEDDGDRLRFEMAVGERDRNGKLREESK